MEEICRIENDDFVIIHYRKENKNQSLVGKLCMLSNSAININLIVSPERLKQLVLSTREDFNIGIVEECHSNKYLPYRALNDSWMYARQLTKQEIEQFI